MRIITAALAAAIAASAFPAMAAQQPSSTVSAQATEKALDAIGAIDTERLFEDKSYAQQMLVHVETVRRSSHYSGDGKLHIDRLRMLALIGSGQAKEAYALATQLAKTAPGEFDLHYFAFLLAVETGSERALDELEFADRSIASKDDRARLVESIDSDTVQRFRQRFYQPKDKARIARSAQVLLNLGWPGPNKLEFIDALRMELAEVHLEKGDIARAKPLVFAVQSTRPVLQILVSRKWDPVRDSGDSHERLAQAIAASDEASERALLAVPDDPEILLLRAQFLRSVGKSAEALELLLPKAENLEWVKEQGENGFWVVNEAAYALVDLKREKDAVSLMQKLLALGLPENPSLISMAINSVGIMVDAGDFKGASEYAVTLATKEADYASPYGLMWMWEGAVCGYSFGGNPQAAQPWLVKLKANEKDNRAALTRALLCANDTDGAAASLIRRLEGDAADDALIALQDYSAGPDLPATKRTLETRMREIVLRPDVQAAIAKKGRVMKVPLSRIYWGLF
ncbi:hypothetical protein [Sphingomonas sp.]|uniref:hypothetical protein n=1 Tax=Sphingomonas sp. TaxID=28214 RepID=UPI0017BE021C|nr:hypothetical protein [Sphingomonas sp.]MBA3511987.1 hypothetical protein [Sphingomonas sp.]